MSTDVEYLGVEVSRRNPSCCGKGARLKPAPFDYALPGSVEEAIALLQEHGDEAKVLAGGQSLVPLLAFRLARPTALIDLDALDELRYLREGDVTAIGAMTTHRDVERNGFLAERCPMITEAMALVGHVAIRNRGTVGGSCAHADPAAEWPALAVALDGEFDVRGPNGIRTIPAADLFFSYFTTSLEPDEVLTETRLRLPPAGAGSAFMELARRHGDFGLAGVAAMLARTDGTVADVRLALMGVGATPVRAIEAEQVLRGAEPSEDLLENAAEAVDGAIEPVGDIHGSAEYRRNAARVLTKRAIGKAWERAVGSEA
jgi:aerobic carbon-monoxide dehydrogenase medium subunit